MNHLKIIKMIEKFSMANLLDKTWDDGLFQLDYRNLVYCSG
jgi:hypothetical protein